MNPISNSNVSKFITRMTKSDAMPPIIALEAMVTTGRTLQAYKRGGIDEARERAIEETTGAVVWLSGVKTLNHCGDKILGRILKNPNINFDVGTDKVLRTPFDNFMKTNAPKKFTAKQIALMKGAKVLSSVVLADMFIGLVVPRINQGITKKYLAKSQKDSKPQQEPTKNKKNIQNPSFKGGSYGGAINVFTNAIENTNTGKLLSTDAGLISGRMYSARSKEERREIAIRDIGSIYFYMWAQGHVGNLINLITTGKANRLNPTTANLLNEHLTAYLDKNGGEVDVNKFKDAVLGNNPNPNCPKINYETAELSSFDKFLNKHRKTKIEPLQVAKVDDLEPLFKEDKIIMSRIREMSKLQPERLGEAVITKQQIKDAINVAEINDPKFLDRVFSEFTGGASKNKFKYVSNKKLYNLKSEMETYVESICKSAKNGKVDKKLLESIKKKNIMFSGLNFAAGFTIAAAFLSTYIPKIQYWYTRKTTGVDAFPGTYNFDKKETA